MFRFIGNTLKWGTCWFWGPLWGIYKVLRFCSNVFLRAVGRWNPQSPALRRVRDFTARLVVFVTLFPVTPTAGAAVAWNEAGRPTTWDGIKEALTVGFSSIINWMT